jgi:hypothetical protein
MLKNEDQLGKGFLHRMNIEEKFYLPHEQFSNTLSVFPDSPLDHGKQSIK